MIPLTSFMVLLNSGMMMGPAVIVSVSGLKSPIFRHQKRCRAYDKKFPQPVFLRVSIFFLTDDQAQPYIQTDKHKLLYFAVLIDGLNRQN